MSDREKAIFKAKLELEIITSEEIQKWAIETLKDNPSDGLALDICFLSTSEQTSNYFKQLSKDLFYRELTKDSVHSLLKDYIEKNVNLVTTQDMQFRPFLQKLMYLSKTVENEDLYDLLNYYDDQFYLSAEGCLLCKPEVVFKEFINDLKDFLATSK